MLWRYKMNYGYFGGNLLYGHFGGNLLYGHFGGNLSNLVAICEVPWYCLYFEKFWRKFEHEYDMVKFWYESLCKKEYEYKNLSLQVIRFEHKHESDFVNAFDIFL